MTITNLPFFRPKNYDDLNHHISQIEDSINSNGILIDNEEVISKTKEILGQYSKFEKKQCRISF